MRQRVAGRAQAHHQHVAAVVRQRVRSLCIQRIPACQQAVDLDAPRHVQHVGQHAGFDLRNVDGLLLLVNAGFHAVVANAVTGAGAHRVVDHDDRQRADRIATLAHRMHLGNLLVERAAGQRDAERIRRDLAFLVLDALRAGVLVALVAQHAVVDFALHFTRRVARIGQREALAAPQLRVRAEHLLGQLGVEPLDLDEVLVVEGLGETEHHPATIFGAVHVRRAPALEGFDLGGDRRLVGV